MAVGGCLLLACLLLAIPARAGSPGWYEVRRGDNLSTIASRFGVSLNDLRRTNRISGDVIHVGQKLTIADPFGRAAGKNPQWGKPCPRPGPVLRTYGQYKHQGVLMPRTGTDIAADVGTAVRSPAHGVVRHLGQVDGFGLVAIIEHAGDYATVLSPLDPDRLRVTVGQAIMRGDVLGVTAAPPEDMEDRRPFLHVELRRHDKAVKPDRLLR